MSISKKPIAIVTGSSRGIGKAIAIRLLDEGYGVIGLYKTSDEAAVLLTHAGIDMQKADVGDEDDVSRAVRYAIDKHQRLDVVINNAGINIQGRIETFSMSDWNAVVATDLTSIFLLSKYCIPALKKAENPIIINISSRLGLDNYAESEFVPYGAVKAAVNNFTIGLARELQNTPIRVNGIIPTPTKTDLFDKVFTADDEKVLKAKGKLGLPKDVASLVIRLVNDISINGQLLFDDRASV